MNPTGFGASGGPVVVGIGIGAGGAESDAALAFAVEEATRRRVPLKLVHGVEPLLTLTALEPAVPAEERERRAEEVLRSVARTARVEHGDDLDVTWSVQRGTSVQALLAESDTASMIVLERRPESALRRLHTGSTTGQVASRASCPVAVVRAGHTRQPDRSGVTVGMDASGHARFALMLALDEAALHEEVVTVLHAFETENKLTNDWVPYGPEELRARREQARVELGEAIAGWRVDFPDAELQTHVIDGPAVDALLTASSTSRLLVVGRHRTGHVGSMALGRTVWRCMSEADCPTLVAPPYRTSHAPERSRAGASVRRS